MQERHKTWNWVGAAGGSGSARGGTSLAVVTHEWEAAPTPVDQIEYELPAVDETEYEIEQVLRSKIVGRKHKTKMYLVRWKGFGPDDDSWEPEESVADLDVVVKFESTSS